VSHQIKNPKLFSVSYFLTDLFIELNLLKIKSSEEFSYDGGGYLSAKTCNYLISQMNIPVPKNDHLTWRA
jgi:hypothetical protein